MLRRIAKRISDRKEATAANIVTSRMSEVILIFNMCLLSQCSCKYDDFFSRWRFSAFDNNSWTQDWVIFELWIHFHKYLLSVISMISICQSALFSYMCSSVQWEGPLSLKTSLVSPNCGELFLKVARQKGSWWERKKGNTCSASDLMHCWYKIPGSVKMGKPRWQNGRLWEHRID